MASRILNVVLAALLIVLLVLVAVRWRAEAEPPPFVDPRAAELRARAAELLKAGRGDLAAAMTAEADRVQRERWVEGER